MSNRINSTEAKDLHAEHHLDFAGTMIEQESESDLQRALYKDLNGAFACT